MAVTFEMAQSVEVPVIRNKLQTLQHHKENRIWWTSTDKSHTNDIEITAYALISLLEDKDIDHIAIFRWLIEQRNENGGFENTHATVVGLQALIKFNEQYNTLTDTQLYMSYTAENDEGLVVERGSFEITNDNLMILQRKKVIVKYYYYY